MFKINYFKLIAAILVCQLAGIIGSVFTRSSVSSWYMELAKPSFNPPSSVFSPVWITLYALMGISLYLIWTKKSAYSKKAYFFFGVQLFLNVLWSVLFFGLRLPLLAFVEIILLWFAIIATMYYFHKISKAAVYLLVPYILWVSFAAILNFYLFYLNI